MSMDTFGWSDIEDIAIALFETHPDIDPASVRFDRLREMIEELEEFEPEADGLSVNEQILEAVQAAWIEEVEDAETGLPMGENDEEDESGYSPNQPFR